MIYIVALTLLAAAIVGVVPALKATGTPACTRGLQALSPGSGSRMQMGRLWTPLIVAQVALTVALLPAAMFQAWMALRFRTGDAGFASREFLTAQLVARSRVDGRIRGRRTRASRPGMRGVIAELERRLRAEATVSDVTFSMAGAGEELAMVVEVEGQPAPLDPVDYNIVEGTKQGHLVAVQSRRDQFLRGVRGADAHGPQLRCRPMPRRRCDASVIVNRALADSLFGGANPLGQAHPLRRPQPRSDDA